MSRASTPEKGSAVVERVSSAAEVPAGPVRYRDFGWLSLVAWRWLPVSCVLLVIQCAFLIARQATEIVAHVAVRPFVTLGLVVWLCFVISVLVERWVGVAVSRVAASLIGIGFRTGGVAVVALAISFSATSDEKRVLLLTLVSQYGVLLLVDTACWVRQLRHSR